MAELRASRQQNTSHRMVAAMNINSETSRIRAGLVNCGHYSFEEAERKLESLSLAIHVGADAAGTVAGQAAALTAVLTASRCFLGGVNLSGVVDRPLRVPLPWTAANLQEAACMLGASTKLGTRPQRTIVLGSGEPVRGWSVRALWNGWSAGVAPASEKNAYLGRGDSALAGIAAGALAVSHAFLAEQDDPRAGRVTQGVSLWAPDAGQAWWKDDGPEGYYLPTGLWLIGLGNLGQAYLWALSCLPYADSNSLELFFQDDDLVAKENWGTSILVKRERYGVLKTRIAEEWADGRGFRSRRIDRRLDADLRRTDREPGIAMAGLDKMPPRRLLGRPGFDYIIDAGLGATARDYRKFRVNAFNHSQDPASHFEGVEDTTQRTMEEVMSLPAYQKAALDGYTDGCGLAQLAGQSVAAPFVSAFVGALVVAQAIRLASSQAPYFSIVGDLDDVRSIRAVLGSTPGRTIVGHSKMLSEGNGVSP
jgi:hypothetical protein